MRSDAIDFNLLIKCAKLSLYAYHNDFPQNVLLSPIALLDGKAWLFANKSSDTLYIVFRGSDSISDLLHNINFVPTDFKKYGKIHGGYYHYYKAVQKPIHQYVAKNSNKIKHVVTTGHSLGGASAVLASMDLCTTDKQMTCITFGTPPMADTKFLESQMMLVPNTYRVVNAEDWAPKLPLPGMRHVGKPILLCETTDEVCSREPPSPQKIVTNHGMQRYVSCLYQTRRNILPPSAHYSPVRVARSSIVKSIRRLPNEATHMPRMM